MVAEGGVAGRMVMTELTDCHKELLRTLVKLRREGTIPEEFRVDEVGPLSIWTGKKDPSSIEVAGLSPLALESLTRANCIFSLPHHQRTTSGTTGIFANTSEYEYEACRDCYITPIGFRAVDSDFAPVDDILTRRPPVELTGSLAAFRADFPDPTRLAFVMMQFSDSEAHKQIWAGHSPRIGPTTVRRTSGG